MSRTPRKCETQNFLYFAQKTLDFVPMNCNDDLRGRLRLFVCLFQGDVQMKTAEEISKMTLMECNCELAAAGVESNFRCVQEARESLQAYMREFEQHKKSRMLRVAEGILDSAASEYLEINLENADSVGNYAYYACDILLSVDKCEKVLAACREWLSTDVKSSDDYYRIVVQPLSSSMF